MNGVLLLDKPAGPTSHDMVDRARRATGVRKIGHAGTLDPFATGLLVLLIGKATKIAPYVSGEDKTYVGTVQWGEATDTLDPTGAVTETTGAPLPDREAVAAAVRGLAGDFEQTAPMYSARKVGGQVLHRLARRGVEVERESDVVMLAAPELLAHDAAAGTFAFRVRCSKGTYVRVVADELCRALGGVGHLAALRRETSGRWRVEDALTAEALESAGREAIAARLVPIDLALDGYPAVRLTAAASAAVRHGRRPAPDAMDVPADLAVEEIARLVDPEGRLLALARLVTAVDEESPVEILRVLAGAEG